MYRYKTRYRVAIQDGKYYLQKKVSFFRNWEYIMIQTGIDTLRPISCDSWEKAETRMRKYIADHQPLDKPVTTWVEIKG
jgi:hypothetical protein